MPNEAAATQSASSSPKSAATSGTASSPSSAARSAPRRLSDTNARPRTRAFGSTLVARSEFAAQHGLSFENPTTGRNQRDLYSALGYARQLKPKDYRERYERGGVAKRVVEAAANETWSRGTFIAETEDPKIETPFELAIDDLFRSIDVWEKLNRADILSGLGRYGILLLGAPGKLNTPLPSLAPVKVTDETGETVLRSPLAYVAPYDETSAKIGECVDDEEDPRFALPLFYDLKLRIIGPSGKTSTTSTQVHWTRVIHVAEGLLDSEVWGEPRLRAVWNYLDDLDKIVGGGAEAAWKRMDPGMQIDIDPEVEMTPEEEDALNDEVDEYQHNLRRVMRTRGATVTQLAATVAAFSTNATSVLRMIAGTAGIPQRLLLGSERGELASTQDRDNWADRIDERRRRFAEPLLRDLVSRLIAYGAVPRPSARPFVVWPKMEELTEEDKAKMVAQLAAANSSMSAAGAGIILSGAEIRDKVYDLPPDAKLEAVEPPKAAISTEGSAGSKAPAKKKGEAI
jgi:hypothetical protein